MHSAVLAIIIVLLLLVIYKVVYADGFAATRLDAGLGPEPEPALVELYEAFGGQQLAHRIVTSTALRQVIKVQLKSIRARLPALSGAYSQIARIEVWRVNGDGPVASTESDFYNSYLEPEFALRANPGRYDHLLTVRAGEDVKLDVLEPTKRIMLFIVI